MASPFPGGTPGSNLPSASPQSSIGDGVGDDGATEEDPKSKEIRKLRKEIAAIQKDVEQNKSKMKTIPHPQLKKKMQDKVSFGLKKLQMKKAELEQLL